MSRSSLKSDKKIIYIDMDGVLCDYSSFLEEKISQRMNIFQVFKIKGSFENLKPIKGAVEAFNLLA